MNNSQPGGAGGFACQLVSLANYETNPRVQSRHCKDSLPDNLDIVKMFR